MKTKVLSAAESQEEMRCLPNADWTIQVSALTLHRHCNNVTSYWTTLKGVWIRSTETIEYSHSSFGSHDIQWKIDQCFSFHICNLDLCAHQDLLCPCVQEYAKIAKSIEHKYIELRGKLTRWIWMRRNHDTGCGRRINLFLREEDDINQVVTHPGDKVDINICVSCI